MMDSEENFLTTYAHLLKVLQTNDDSIIILLPSSHEGRGMGMICSEIPYEGRQYAFNKSVAIRAEFLVACAVESRMLFDEVEDEFLEDEEMIIEWIPEDEDELYDA
jgi:hypothetical protein